MIEAGLHKPRCRQPCRWRQALAALLLALPTLTPLQAQTAVDAEADRLLKASMAYVGALQQFAISGHTTLEVVLKSGQKVQLDSALEAVVRRPDRLRVRRGSGGDERSFYYDGRSLTLWNPARREYASLPAPDTLAQTLDFARERLGIVAPAGDLIDPDAYRILMGEVTSGLVVGKAVIEGARCDHLAFRAPLVDWQIWIEEGARPLPRKIVITTRDQASEPQFTLVITKWNLQPRIEARTFGFVAPKDARKVELPAGK